MTVDIHAPVGVADARWRQNWQAMQNHYLRLCELFRQRGHAWEIEPLDINGANLTEQWKKLRATCERMERGLEAIDATSGAPAAPPPPPREPLQEEINELWRETVENQRMLLECAKGFRDWLASGRRAS